MVSHLFDVVKSNALIATNSSSYLPWQLSDNKIQRQRIVGLHFFYPVDFKGIVEFIGGEVEEQQIKNVKHFLDKKKCEILYQNKDNAFLLNRLMLHLQVEAFRLHNSKGYSIPEIDKAVDTFLFPIGIFFMMDHIGLDILEMAVKNYMSLEEQLDGLIDFQYFLNEKVNAGHLGLKTNVGIYDYSKDVHFESLDEDRLKEIAKQLADTYFKALNNYVGHGYSTNKELTNAMDVYLDCETECWKELLV